MARRGFVVAWLVIAVLALAGGADAKRGGVPALPEQASPPEHASAHGLQKRSEPDAPPAAGPAPEPAPPADPPASKQPPPASPPAEDAPVEAAPQAPAAPEPAAPQPAPAAPQPAESYASPPPATYDPAPQAPAAVPSSAPSTTPAAAASSADPEPSSSPAATQSASERAPSAPRNTDRIDEHFAGSLAGATSVRAPSWTAPRAPPSAEDGDAGGSWWIHLAWALPIVGVGGVAAVLAVGVKRRRVSRARAQRPRMVPVSPDDVPGLLANGNGAVARGAYDEAVAWFERAIRLAPRLAVAYFCKGICLAANGRTADAYGALRAAVDAEPADAVYRIHFARVALALGKHAEAMDALAIVARAMPELGPAMLDDPQLAALRDHPRFLMICGEL